MFWSKFHLDPMRDLFQNEWANISSSGDDTCHDGQGPRQTTNQKSVNDNTAISIRKECQPSPYLKRLDETIETRSRPEPIYPCFQDQHSIGQVGTPATSTRSTNKVTTQSSTRLEFPSSTSARAIRPRVNPETPIATSVEGVVEVQERSQPKGISFCAKSPGLLAVGHVSALLLLQACSLL